ncbi:MEDS domain-containing protein [Actinosynnema sp. NPDC050436]|uniref:MEDS domain-containing protein n=1 Tax=Actinosynnema sp. NPDC050436 TaxID=3155659 RepID=UPI0033D93747
MDHVRGLGDHDHVCWQYDGLPEFRARAVEFLTEGLALGHRVLYVASGEVDALVEDLRGIDGLDRALGEGSARVASLDATYPVGTVIDPVQQVRAYTRATEEAVQEGYTGLRVAADCTSLVGTPEQVEAFARYEHLIDHYMADRPFSAVCAYDRTRVAESSIHQVACMHPRTNAVAAGFRLHGAGGRVTALGGEVDPFTSDLFALALSRADLQPQGGRLVLDATGLAFIDHHGLRRLAEHAAARDLVAVLRTDWPGAARLVELLQLDSVFVEQPA